MTGPVRPREIDYDRLRARLERAVVRHTCGPLAAQRDDIVQAAMIRMMGVIERSDAAATFTEGYLMRTLYTATIDEIRRVARRAEVPLVEEGGGDLPEPRDDPEREHLSRELGRQILACLARLGRPRRVAVALYLMGNSGPETARALRWSDKRVNNLVYRGLADLRRCLEAHGASP